MAKKLPFTSIALKSILQLSLLAISLTRCAKTERVLLSGQGAQPATNHEPEVPNSDEPPVATPSVAPTQQQSQLTFFMHDILGGTAPSERIVAGIVADTQTSKPPFSKPNNGVFPIKGGIPLVDATNINGNSITNGATTSTVIKNIGKNKVNIDKNSLPYVTPDQLPAGATLDKLLFGRITVIDDEITEGHELGSSVIGKAQGFHLASSLDGSSQTMAFTALFHNGDQMEEDSISFFGVHRTAAPESYLAVVGGTGKYDNARGSAKIETPQLPHQHTTNGNQVLRQITVYLTL